MVQELRFNDIGIRLDPNTKPHINLVCNRCGKILDVDEPILEEALMRVERRMGFNMTGQRIDIYGYCKKCTKGMEKR